MKEEANSNIIGKPDTCSFCKGNLKKGKADFMVKSDSSIVSVKNVPALICENCGEAYYTSEVSRRIDKVMEDFHKGDLMAHPVAAGEIEFDRVA